MGACWEDPLTWLMLALEPRFMVFLETPGSSLMTADKLAFLTMVIALFPNLPAITGFSIGSATAD